MASLWLLEARELAGDDRPAARTTKHWLQPGTYSVGRSDADILITDDKSVSRQHARLIVPALGEIPSGVAPYITVEDTSRFGTRIVSGSKADPYYFNQGSERALHNWDICFGSKLAFRLYFLQADQHFERIALGGAIQDLRTAKSVLLRAAEQGDLAALRRLLAAGLDPSLPKSERWISTGEWGGGWTALHYAADGGHLDAVQALLAAGASPAARTAAGLTALQLAAQRGCTPVLFALLLAGKAAADHGCDGTAALRIAAREGHLPAVHALLGAGVAPDSGAVVAAAAAAAAKDDCFAVLKALLAAGGEATQGALCAAAGASNLRAVQLLLEAGVGPAGSGAIVEAAGIGSLEIVEALLAAGEPPNDIGSWQRRPALVAAAAGSHVAIMQRLLAAGADMMAVDAEGLTALEAATTPEAAHVLLEAGALVQDPSANHFPLITAAELGRAGVVSVMLAAGGDVKACDDTGWTALMAAAGSGSEEAVGALLAAGADVDAAGREQGETALHLAIAGGHLGALKALLAAGADANKRSACGLAPLHAAAQRGHASLASAMLAAGASVHAADSGGRTPLHIAAAARCKGAECGLGVVQALLAAGADPNAVAGPGSEETPLMSALGAGNLAAAAALLAAGATPTTYALERALACQQLLRGSWMVGLLPAGSVTGERLRRWARAAFAGRPRALAAMLRGVWALGPALPPEILRHIAAMRCLVG